MNALKTNKFRVGDYVEIINHKNTVDRFGGNTIGFPQIGLVGVVNKVTDHCVGIVDHMYLMDASDVELLETSDQFKDAHNDYWHQLQMNAICVAKYQGISIFDMKAYFVSYGPYMLDKYEALKLHVLEVDIDYTFAARLDKRLEKAEKYMRQYVQRFLAKIKR